MNYAPLVLLIVAAAAAWRARALHLRAVLTALVLLDVATLALPPFGAVPYEGRAGVYQRLQMFTFALWPGLINYALASVALVPGRVLHRDAKPANAVLLAWLFVAGAVAASYPWVRGEPLLKLYAWMRVAGLFVNISLALVLGRPRTREAFAALALALGAGSQLAGAWLKNPANTWPISQLNSCLTYGAVIGLLGFGGTSWASKDGDGSSASASRCSP